jgi:putative restriction endonuclease
VQQGPAALSINTSSKSPYDDEPVEGGFMYAYRSGAIDQPDNRALRSAYELQVPLVYFVATRPGWYKPLYPTFVSDDDDVARRVLVTPGRMVGPLDEREPVSFVDLGERRYAVRETRVRLHQARFRGASCPHTAVGARSASSRRYGSSTRPTSSGTSRTPAKRSSRTA